MSLRSLSVAIGGEAGFGIMSAGLSIAKVAVRYGYHVFESNEYPSIVRGGHNITQIIVGIDPVVAPRLTNDLLIALDQGTWELHKDSFTAEGGVVYDPAVVKMADDSTIARFAIPLNELATTVGGSLLLRNTVALGAAMAALGWPLRGLQRALADEFSKKKDVLEKNLACAVAGYAYFANHYQPSQRSLPLPAKKRTRAVVTGNEAIALGAVAAGMQFCAIYPMTPISSIIHTLAPWQEECGFVYKQPEDEISGIMMAIGASFAGARSMVATAGGGFCLMTEGYGLAGMTETPLVIIEGMRGGPATGLPTWTEQGDLRFMLHAHQGDFPRIVLAAGDPEEAFYLTVDAFNLADQYQTPVVVMVDKYVCESHWSLLPFSARSYAVARGAMHTRPKKNYERYAVTASGISSRAVPGQGQYFVVNSDEHSELGYSSEDAVNRQTQLEKRMRKLETCAKNSMPEPILYGSPDATTTIVSWGSNKGAILEAIKGRPEVNFLHLTWMNPFPVEAVKKRLSRAKRIIDVECNFSAQLAGIIAEKTGIRPTETWLKYNGRPWYPEELMLKLS